MSVKSDRPIRPGSWTWRKITSRSGAVQRAPLADAPLQRPPDPGAELGMPAQQLLEDGDRPQARARLQHRHDLGVEDVGQRIGPPPLARRALLRGRSRVLRDAVAGGGAEPGAGGGDGDRVGRCDAS